MSTTRLSMRGVRKSFGPTLALAGVDLEVAPGDVHALVGENGAGKSTLMKVLSGALQPDAGDLLLDGARYAPATTLDAARAGVAMVYQELSLVPHLGAADNIVLGRERSRYGLLSRSRARRLATEALATLGHDDIDLDRPVRDLPVAVQQVVELARAMAHADARVLILDEPTSSLGAHDVERLFVTIRRLRHRGVSVIYISHILEEVLRIADRYTVLRDGRTVGGGATEGASAATIVSLMAGRDIGDVFPRSARTPGAVRLEVRELQGQPLPRAATLELRAGEVLGIAGLVGAGRTELLRAVFGLAAVRRGKVRVAAYGGPGSPWHRLAQGVSLLSEDRKGEGLAVNLSVADNVTLSRLSGLGPARLIFRSRQDAAASKWIERLHIRTPSPRQAAWQLSGGNQQKVAFARLLHHDADVLLLDEPTRGIDVASKTQIYELIDRLAAQGKAILMVSSYVPELIGVCDRVAVMARGVLGPCRPVSTLTEHGLLMEAMGQA
jgi:ribose transport system ATP-binding protein